MALEKGPWEGKEVYRKGEGHNMRVKSPLKYKNRVQVEK